MNVKHGFSSTLNRFLGKKSKGHQLSKSTTNLSLSSHIDTIPLSSHLDQNRIAPLPVATSNAPFEQTFRITVLLPKGQLYVTRLGAKTKLEKLLELVCENKQLDTEKYEFRHPIDTSQVFNCELTIGAVGLSEIRLCHKSEAYDNFNADEIIKLRHTGRDSLSSSEFSSRNSKNTLKTASPYSSTNSLNSIDSTGMSTNYRGAIVSLPPQAGLHRTTGNHHPPVAPTRKKRVAPRPPSQNSIPEREVSAVSECKEVHLELSKPKKDFHVSTPNLSQYTEVSKTVSTDIHRNNVAIDCNGNNNNSKDNNKQNGFAKPNGHIYCNGGHTSPDVVQKSNQRDKSVPICAVENDTNGNRYSSENDLSSHRSSNGSILSYIANDCSEIAKLPEPVPRKRIIISKKKAPAPPPRTIPPPTAPPRTITPNASPQKQAIMIEDIVHETTLNGDVSTNLAKDEPEDERNMQNVISTVKTKETEIFKQIKNDITKIESEGKEEKEEEESNIVESPVDEVAKKPLQLLISDGSSSTNQSVRSTNEVSSQEGQSVKTPTASLQNTENNSIITNGEEPPTSPVEISVSEQSEINPKKQLDSSSDEEEVKVYNLKLGSIVKVEEKSVKDSNSTSPTSDNTSASKDVDTNDGVSTRSASPGWTYTIPAPPNFADVSISTSATVDDTILINKPNSSEADETISIDTAKSTSSDLISDVPITPIIKERPCVDFELLTDNRTIVNEISNSDQSETSDNVITSDIEDGYRVGLSKNDKESVLIDQLEKRDDFVERNSEEISLNKRNSDDCCRTRQISPPSSLESYDSCKSDVITELNNAINEQKQLTHKIEDSAGIESVKPCALSNFKIQTYSNPNGHIKTAVESHENNAVEINVTDGKIFENTNGTHSHSKDDSQAQQKPLVEDDKMYRKRSSLTLSNNPLAHLSRPRGSITRSDSFHSTRYPNNLEAEESLTLRSSSFLSLLNAQKMDQRINTINGNLTDSVRQKSASELSIGESPSLQSLIVMKSILNSRKNSLTNENFTQKSSTMNQKIYINPESTRKSTQVETVHDCDSSKENSPKNKMLSQQTTSVEKLEKTDEPEKRWKYQGPPAINLSTWSERPKVQVSIKDDSDYKFGGGGCVSVNGVSPGNGVATFSSNYRHSTPNVPLFGAEVAVSNKIQIPEKVVNEPRVPFVRSVEYKKPTLNAQIEVEQKSLNEPDASHYSRPLSTGNTMTVGRIPKINRTNFIPVVRGFRNFEQVEEKERIQKERNGVQGNTHGENVTVLKVTTNGIQRSNSKVAGQPVERNILKLSNSNNKFPSHNVYTEKEKPTNVSPFQVTLRKTGFKEKIISPTEVDNEGSPLHRSNQQNCAKIEMKLTAVQSPNKVIIEPSQKYRQRQQQQSAPPPPPPPVIRSVVTKQPSSLQTGFTADPRDQLLSAIRNFNRDFLRRQ